LRQQSQDTRRLAAKLQAVEPDAFGILQCYDVVKTTDSSKNMISFEIVFEVPAASAGQPLSLRGQLASSIGPTLTERMKLARQLAAAVSHINNYEFVHKNIRPENLIGFNLIGFQQVRTVNDQTYSRGDDAWDRDLYRHPDRQGQNPQEKYNISHNMYSLGVCLLEIGVWSPFVEHTADGTVPGAVLGPRLQGFAEEEAKSGERSSCCACKA
jgi:hypothetical protein